jgi:hypothetical protein
VNIEPLLRSLNAAAETERLVRRNFWILDETNEPENEARDNIRRAQSKRKIDMRLAALVISIDFVARAMLCRGLCA